MISYIYYYLRYEMLRNYYQKLIGGSYYKINLLLKIICMYSQKMNYGI